jgi:hypothetical protein
VRCIEYSLLLPPCWITPRALATAGGLKLSVRRVERVSGFLLQKFRNIMGVHGKTYIASICTPSMVASPGSLPGVVSDRGRPCSLADSSPQRDCVFQAGVSTSDFVQTPSVPATTAMASANQTTKGGWVQALTRSYFRQTRACPGWPFPIVTLRPVSFHI